jgi:PAS domain S-box-containing protein
MTDALPHASGSPDLSPTHEAQRLAALQRYSILDTPPEAAFDRITALAARLFAMPIAIVSLIDDSRAWFKSAYGTQLQEVRREDSLCSLTLTETEVVTIPDTHLDPRLAHNPIVHDEPSVRFYAGAPLITLDGFNLGTLCLVDAQPRPDLTAQEKETLADLAAMVVDELELRLAARKVAQIDAALVEVTQGVSNLTGEAFFAKLVLHFTQVLGVQYAYIGLLQSDPTAAQADTIQTIAVCAQGQMMENFSYLLNHAPCQEVIRTRQLCCYPQNVRRLFPNAPMLAPLGVESYGAIPFFDMEGQPQGLLGVMDCKPLENVHLMESLLRIFALRIATELEGQKTERLRQQTQQQLESLMEQRTAELLRTNELLLQEIVERQQAERALQKEQEVLNVLLEHVQAGIVACNADGILTLFNRAAREFHGVPAQPISPEEWAQYYDLYLPDGKTRMPKEAIPLFRALQGELVENSEMVIAPAHGQSRTLLASGQAIADSHGHKQGAVVVMHDITERKQAEAELLISDTALQQMPDAIILTDLEGVIQRWLGNAEQIFGYTAAEVIGQPIRFLHHPEQAATMTLQIARAIRKTGEFCGEVPCRRKDGSDVLIETTAKTVKDKTGNPIFYIGINKDITERTQAAAERARLMREQVREQTARLEAEADQRRSAFLADISTVLASALEYENTLPQLANLVVPFFADWCAVDLLQEEGQVSSGLNCAAVAHRDPQKVALAWRLHHQYSSPLGTLEGVTKVLRTGYPEMAERIADDLLVAAVQDAAHLQILRDLGLKSYLIMPLIARDQMLGAMTFVMAESDRHYSIEDLSLAEEIAHRTAIAIDNARLYRNAQQAQQAAVREAQRSAEANRIKDEFLAVLSHELRSPLNPILGWIKLLRDGRLDEVKTAHALETIERNAKLQAQLIEDLLDVSRILRGKLRLNIAPVNLVAVIQAALETVRLAAEAKSIQVQTALDPAVGSVLGDAARLQQVVWNLLSNAVKFTPTGGQITITLAEGIGPDRSPPSSQTASTAQIVVADTGKGIAPDFLPHVFESFRQADSTSTRQFGGLGLGLAIVRHLTELHGGTVTVNSAGEDQGATFTVSLPLLSEERAEMEPIEQKLTLARNVLPLQGVRVLLVDDEADARELTAFILEQAGAIATVAASAAAALTVFHQTQPEVLISDISMPGFDGYALMRQIRTYPPEQGGMIPAIALTAYAGEVNKKQAMAAGFQLHLTKPLDPDTLVRAIARLLDSPQRTP